LKALVAADSDRILGFTMFAVDAGAVMTSVQIAMVGGLPYTALLNGILVHPSMGEGLIPLFSSAASEWKPNDPKERLPGQGQASLKSSPQ
jgi:Pyridine nucleotide-disulphide oxidoreductase, dimerisation domain